MGPCITTYRFASTLSFLLTGASGLCRCPRFSLRSGRVEVHRILRTLSIWFLLVYRHVVCHCFLDRRISVSSSAPLLSPAKCRGGVRFASLRQPMHCRSADNGMCDEPLVSDCSGYIRYHIRSRTLLFGDPAAWGLGEKLGTDRQRQWRRLIGWR